MDYKADMNTIITLNWRFTTARYTRGVVAGWVETDRGF
jgi:hypothetical protein